MTTSGVTSSYTYDPWGRLASRSATISGQSYTATYTYRFGDKLQRIDSNFPGETPVVLYNYDGLGKRRLKAIGNDTTYWRWDAGYSVLAQYQDSVPDWSITGFDRFFVPFGHTALAEADLDASGVPANAAYTYLAHDHLGTSTHGYDQSKTVVSQNIHLPFGQRSYASGNSPYHEFTGKPWDAESQMYYFPYRYYSPNMNRWTGVDPCCLIDGPNLYGYVTNNPLQFYDIKGTELGTLIVLCFITVEIGTFITSTIYTYYTNRSMSRNVSRTIDINKKYTQQCRSSEDSYNYAVRNFFETKNDFSQDAKSNMEYIQRIGTSNVTCGVTIDFPRSLPKTSPDNKGLPKTFDSLGKCEGKQ